MGTISREGLAEAGVAVEGDASVLERLVGVLDAGGPNFEIVTPDRPDTPRKG